MKLSEQLDAKIAKLKGHSACTRRVTAEVFGTAAELVQDHEFMLQQASLPVPRVSSRPWTIHALQQRFKAFNTAQRHFGDLYGVKAKGWAVLADKVNTIESALVHLGLRQRSPDRSK